MAVKGLKQLNVKLGKIGAETRTEVRRALQRGALRVENRAVEGIINPPKTGRIYPSKHRKGAKHQASAPGEFPAADSGRLHQSITSVEASKEALLRFETGTNVDYGTYLELGTSRMEPRPFMAPAFDENVGQVRIDVQNAIKRAARKGSR
jgi:HK97 gp10 family phage protein